jgi:hypothetical protein
MSGSIRNRNEAFATPKGRDTMPSIRRVRFQLPRAGAAALVGVLCALLARPEAALALSTQDAQSSTPPPAGAPQAGADESAKLTPDQLDSLVAPIALYPDPLIAQCLVAATYPIDIIAAQQWLAKNSNLKGEELEKAAQQQDWDPSIQALVSLPDALKVLSENIQWTEDLGDAVLAQQGDVMDAVQRMRKKAKDNGKLESSEQQKVETKVIESKETIIIQPAQPEVIYVPQYNPTVVYPPPVYPYPPMYYPPYVPGAALVSFGVGMAWGAAISGGWGCGWGGGNNDITINNNNNYVKNSNVKNNQGNRSGNSNWQHNAQQRGGAPYKDKATASKYGGSARGDSASSRSAGAQSRQQSSRSGDRASASSRSSGAGGSASSRSSGGGASSRSGGSSSFSGGGGGGGDRVGSRSASPSSSRGGSSAFSGGSGSGARSSSSRGSSSMSRSGGGRSGGGGGGRRR